MDAGATVLSIERCPHQAAAARQFAKRAGGGLSWGHLPEAVLSSLITHFFGEVLNLTSAVTYCILHDLLKKSPRSPKAAWILFSAPGTTPLPLRGGASSHHLEVEEGLAEEILPQLTGCYDLIHLVAWSASAAGSGGALVDQVGEFRLQLEGRGGGESFQDVLPLLPWDPEGTRRDKQ